MKIKNLWSVALMALVTLAGCNKEPQNVTGETQTNCINVSLRMSNPAATKAGEVFANGSSLESQTDRVVFAFFNAQGVCVATSYWDNPTFNTISNGGSIEQDKTDKVTFELPIGAKLPVSMMVYVNPIDNNDLNMTLAEAKSKIRTSYVGTTTNYGFAMNNAVYFDASGKKMVEVVTPADAYFSAESDGQGIDAIPVYVERMAVKVSLEYKENYQNEAIELNNTDKIKFVPEAWGLTCTEKEMYLIKHFKDSYTPDFVNANPTYVFTGWNDITNHRSYWANSVSYGLSNDSYPDVSDDLIVSPAAFFQQDFNNFDKTSYPIAYLSYNQITATPANPLYCNENTIRNFVPSAATSVIIKGHYVYAEGANAGNNVGTFYVRGTDFYTEKTLKNFFINRIKNYLKKADGSDITISSDTDPVYDDFELVHPTQSLNTGSKNTERLVTLNLKSDKASNYKTIETEGGAAQTITDLAAVNNRIYNIASVAEAFKDGKAVFFWALRHLNQNDEGIGHYGAVRNHWYKVTVNSIKNLGTGIFDEDAPLIPHDDETDFGINATVNILAWRLVTNIAEL